MKAKPSNERRILNWYDSVYIKKWLKEFDESLGAKFLKIFRNGEKEINDFNTKH